VRATAQASQRAAPAASNCAASAFTVAPVVTTSSTIATFNPMAGLVTENTAATLRKRCAAGWPVCGTYRPRRSTPHSQSGRASAWLSVRAISTLWL